MWKTANYDWSKKEGNRKILSQSSGVSATNTVLLILKKQFRTNLSHRHLKTALCLSLFLCQSLMETIFDHHCDAQSQWVSMLECVNPLCWILPEADRAVRSTLRVQLCLGSTVHRLKIDVCPNPRLLPHAHTHCFFLCPRDPKQNQRVHWNRPGVPAHPIAHEKLIGFLSSQER